MKDRLTVASSTSILQWGLYTTFTVRANLVGLFVVKAFDGLFEQEFDSINKKSINFDLPWYQSGSGRQTKIVIF